MSIYALRYGDLIKIGFSSNLAARVKGIIQMIPGDVTFIGHMPGDREVEAHFHSMFEGSRFSGEWFVSTPALETTLSCLLTAELPSEPRRAIPARDVAVDHDLQQASHDLRVWAGLQWPAETHQTKISRVTEILGWKHSRTKSLYNAERKSAPRPHEVQQIRDLVSAKTQA